MNVSPWLSPALTALTLIAYLLYLARAQDSVAWRTHASLRDAWFDAMSGHAGSEILAVQTLRNSVMTATMTASTAALGLMGAVSLAAPALQSGSSPETGAWTLYPRTALELLIMVCLLAALIASTMAIRYYHHAGFICAMPVGSEARGRWGATGKAHLRAAGALYGWGLRCLVLVTPLLVTLVYGPAGPVAAVAVVVALLRLERLSVPA